MSSAELEYRHLSLLPIDGWLVVSFNDRKLMDVGDLQRVGDELFHAAATNPNLVLNFAGVEFLPSSAFTKLILLQKKTTGQSGKLVLCSVREQIMEVFRITRLARLFPIVADVAEAIPVIASKTIRLTCPLKSCECEIAVPVTTFLNRSGQLSCHACGVTVQLTCFQDLKVNTAEVLQLRAPSYEGHFFDVSGQFTPGDGVGFYSIHAPPIVDLYAFDLLLDVWQSLPAPRSAILDLSKVSELSARAMGQFDTIASPGEFLAVFRAKPTPTQTENENPSPPFTWNCRLPLHDSKSAAVDSISPISPRFLVQISHSD